MNNFNGNFWADLVFLLYKWFNYQLNTWWTY